MFACAPDRRCERCRPSARHSRLAQRIGHRAKSRARADWRSSTSNVCSPLARSTLASVLPNLPATNSAPSATGSTRKPGFGSRACGAQAASASTPRARSPISPSPPCGFSVLPSSHATAGEIFDHRRAAHLPLAGKGFERIGPRLAGSHFEHGVEVLADFLIAVERAAVQRSFPASLVAGGLEELELQDSREEIAGVGYIARDVILRARIELALVASDRRDDALIFAAGRSTPGQLAAGWCRRTAPAICRPSGRRAGRRPCPSLRAAAGRCPCPRSAPGAVEHVDLHEDSGVIDSAIMSPMASWNPSFAPLR